MYATLGIDALIYGINETEATHVITTTENLSKFDVCSGIFFTQKKNYLFYF